MNQNLHSVQRTAYLLLSLVLLIWLLHTAAFIIVPLVWGIFFSFALYPISNWLEEKRFPRALAITISIV
jgi:predicted PurR-regulated permease PerM